MALVGVGFGVGLAVAVGVGVGLGVGVAATTSGDGTEAGELPRSALAGALLAGLRGLTTAEAEPAEPEIAALDVPDDPTCEVAPADDEWLLVHAASAAAQRIVTTQRAGVGLVVRARLAIAPG